MKNLLMQGIVKSFWVINCVKMVLEPQFHKHHLSLTHCVPELHIVFIHTVCSWSLVSCPTADHRRSSRCSWTDSHHGPCRLQNHTTDINTMCSHITHHTNHDNTVQDSPQNNGYYHHLHMSHHHPRRPLCTQLPCKSYHAGYFVPWTEV